MERALWPTSWSKKEAKMAPVMVYSAQASYDEGLYCKQGCNIYRTAGIEKETQMAKEFEEFRRRVNSFRRWVRTASMWPSAR